MQIVNTLGVHPDVFAAAQKAQAARLGMMFTLRKEHNKPVFSVTELVNPPYQYKLLQDNPDVSWEVEKMLPAMMGSGFHEYVARRCDIGATFAEERLTWAGESAVVTGATDSFRLKDKWLADHKTCKTWKWRYRESKDSLREDETQTRIYATMWRRDGFAIERITLELYFQDWMRGKIHEDGYPQRRWLRHEVTPWAEKTCGAWLRKRVDVFLSVLAAPIDAVVPCTPRDRWEREECFAVQKSDSEGKPTGKAKKLFRTDTYGSMERAGNEAHAHAENMKGYDVHYRPPQRTRCATWCAAAPVCPDYAAFKERYCN